MQAYRSMFALGSRETLAIVGPLAGRHQKGIGMMKPVLSQRDAPMTAAAAPPIRVQLSRRKGWSMPENTAVVTRATQWGNPFIVVPHARPGAGSGARYICVPTVDDAVECFREMMQSPGETAEALRAALPTLRGKNLACWCKLDAPCHADVLLELANKI